MLEHFKEREWYVHDSKQTFECGRLGWAPILFAEDRDNYKLLKSFWDDSEKCYKYTLRKPDKKAWTPESHPPIYVKPSLKATEEVVCSRSKRRPVVLLGVLDHPEDFAPSKALKRDLHFKEQWLCLPLWSYEKGEEKFQLYVECLAFDSLFPFIACPAVKGEKCPDEDSIGRIDLIQPIHSTMIERKGIRVSDEILELLYGNICYFFSKEICPSDSQKPSLYEDFRSGFRKYLDSILPAIS